MIRDERAALAHMVIGPERAEKIIAQEADRWALRWGKPLDQARRYIENCYQEAHAATIVRIGQVWGRRDGKEMPGDAFASLTGQERSDTVTVHAFDGDMVQTTLKPQAWTNICMFDGLWLVAWPEEYDLADTLPEPPSEPITDLEGEESGEEEKFDPRALFVLVHREGSYEPGKLTAYLPLLGEHYTARNMVKPEYEPSYGNLLDVPAYLAEHLADYRSGWSDWLDQFTGVNKPEQWIDFFNELDGGCECAIEVAAYLGWWLWQRVRSDVVSEHGGTVDDYAVTIMWSPGKADVVLEAAPYADPEWEIPPDHPLVQCDGQDSLFGAEAVA